MHLLFDLDGTLTNPAEGITACIRHTLGDLENAGATACVKMPQDLADAVRNIVTGREVGSS